VNYLTNIDDNKEKDENKSNVFEETNVSDYNSLKLGNIENENENDENISIKTDDYNIRFNNEIKGNDK